MRPVVAVALAGFVGVGVGFGAAQLATFHSCPTGDHCPARFFSPEPRFTFWQCAVFGAATASLVLLAAWPKRPLSNSRLRWVVAAAPVVASIVIGLGVWSWTQQLGTCVPNACVGGPFFEREMSFAPWQCVVFGVMAAIAVTIVVWAINRRWPVQPNTRQREGAAATD